MNIYYAQLANISALHWCLTNVELNNIHKSQ